MAKWRVWTIRTFRFLGAAFILFIGWRFYRVGYQYGVAAWNSARAFSFLKDWLPAVVGVAVGVIPGSEWERKMKFRYRVIIVIVGFIYSGVLYHAETLADTENTKQLGETVEKAVTQANAHSDKQFAKVTDKVGGLKDTVGSLGDEVKEVGEKLDAKTGEINTNIGKVGKPDPIPPPKIEFTLSDAGPSSKPVRTETIKPNDDGTYSFKFNVINTSDVNAEEAEMWLTVCNVCDFVDEPKGSDKPPGESSTMRHFVLGSMHAGVGHGETTVTFKAQPSAPKAWFGVTFAYACKTCGKPHNEPDYVLNVDYSSTQAKPPQ